jgi:DNA-binding MarR family transcriptional regulator
MKIEEEIKQKSFKSEFQKAMINLMFTGCWLVHKQKQFFKKWDISPQQYNVLRILRGQNNSPITVAAIQERMMDKMSNASRLVEKLKKKNLVTRKISKSDRRQAHVFITKKGIDLLNEIDNYIDEQEKYVRKLTLDEAIELNRMLNKIRE